MDHRELLTTFSLSTDATANDLRALEAIGQSRVCIAHDLVYSEAESAEARFLIEMACVRTRPTHRLKNYSRLSLGWY